MLTAAVAILSVAAGCGAVLFVLNLRHADAGRPPSWMLRLAHGGLGSVGLIALIIGLRGPRRGIAAGAGQFGTYALVLLGAAFLLGLTIVVLSRRRRPPGIVMVAHAIIAIFGYVILAAYASLS